VEGSVDPIRDIETINLELIFSDLDVLERRLMKAQKGQKSGDKALMAEAKLLERLKAHLEEGIVARRFEPETDEEAAILEDMNLLTYKKVIYATNVKEADVVDGNDYVARVQAFAAEEGSEAFIVCAQIEQEIAELDDDEKLMFLEDLGISQSGLDRLIAASYKLLGLISYLTAGPKEIRAWTIVNGTKAPGAAGKIHSDFERGFIRAEVVAYDDLKASGTYAAAKEKGLVRIEGKEYVVKDGDIMLFRFNV
jgi:GTP-binding protein YchF